MEVHSQEHKGSEIAVCFPAVVDSGERTHLAEAVEVPEGRGQIVLIVDDEESIRQITQTTLETFGYRVLTASDETEALAQYATYRKVDVVITDLIMPFMDGVATIRALRRLAPRLKIICASGLADDANSARIARAEAGAFLAKPYPAKQLLTALAQLL